MLTVEIISRGVYDQRGVMVPIGTALTIDGATLPASLVNKARIVSAEAAEAVAVTNPARKGPAKLTAKAEG